MSARRVVPDEAAVHDALGAVRDPELDESITDLDFVSSIRVEGNAVEVRLRLPTYFCAPNFAWLMVADAKQAIAAVPGVTAIDVQLDDHFASGEINAGVATDVGFGGSFPGLADGGLADLRTTFRRKAFLARQHRLLTQLREDGAALCALRVGALPPGPETAVYLQRRTELGLAIDADAPLVVTQDGMAVEPDQLDDHLAWIRTVAVSIEGNAGFCRGLLKTRYPTTTRSADETKHKEAV
ncbi:iron-sulfur cluster assembly protein [soil metagenome]